MIRLPDEVPARAVPILNLTLLENVLLEFRRGRPGDDLALVNWLQEPEGCAPAGGLCWKR